MRKLFFIKFTFFIILIFGSFIMHASASFNFQEIILIKEDGSEIVVPREDFSQWVTVQSTLLYDSTYRTEIEAVNYCSEQTIVCNFTKSERLKHTIRKVDKITTSEKSIQSFVEDLARKYDQDPVDATFTVEDGKVTTFSLSRDGKKINIAENTKNILNAFSQKNSAPKIKLAYDTQKPEVNANDADKLGIATLIGEGVSNFTGSTKSRIHNVEVATSRFDGVLIKPGAEFSFVETLGPVDGEHGYKEELVIKNNETTPEFGGGVCQVSTTAFRAAIYSGLQITARKNHAYPVSYYAPHGMDATIYIPRPDLRFKNNTPGHILIQTKIDIPTKKLVFQFYGTDDGRKTEVDGPHITSREADGSMKTVFTQKVTTAKGEILIDDTFRSNYDSPDKYPKPGEEIKLTTKPSGWSDNEWKKYKKDNGL